MADIEGGQPQHKSQEQRTGELELYKAALGDDWSKAKQIFDKPGQQIKPSSRINAQGETALHIAAAAGNFHFVRKLVQKMTEEENTADLAIRSEVAVSGDRRESDSFGNQMADIEAGQPQHVSQEQRKEELELHKAALSGDWSKAEEILKKHGGQIQPSSRTNAQGETALHIAAAAGHFDFVRKLVDRMGEGDLAIRSEVAVPGERRESENPTQSAEEGNTAFFCAAASGNVKIAEIMLKKNPDLATIRGRGNNLPIYMAALLGHDQMVRYLYDIDPKGAGYTDDDYFGLLVALIDSDIYDVALQIVQEKRSLATKTDSNGETALHAFARKPYVSSTLSTINIIRAAGFSLLNIFRKPKKEWLEGVKLLWEQVTLEDHKTISKLMIGKTGGLIFIAAKQGNYQFLTTLIRSYPDLIWQVDKNNYTIFHIAVLHRHVAIFNLILEIGSAKTFICMKIDSEGNNILHLAGKSPLPPSGMPHALDAAFQMQQEVAWFKGVRKTVGSQNMKEKNKKGKSPMELFEEEHEELRKEGEKWMKNVAKSCMLISTLVTTMAFAAAFALPGGVRQENGIPVLLNDEKFRDFATSDATSLIASASSIFCFLSILTSSYSIDDFGILLSTKLIFGLFFLYGSIAAMVTAFGANFSLVFETRKTSYVYWIHWSEPVPVVLFVFLCLFPLSLRATLLIAFRVAFRPWKKSLFVGSGNP